MTATGTAAPDTTRLADPAVRSVTVGATALIALFAVEYVAVGTAMPSVARDLDGLELYALAFGATIAASVIGMILGGWWSDRSGPRPVVLTGVVAFVTGLLLAGSAPSMELFVGGRAVQGLGSGLATVAVYVVIAQGVPDALRPRMFSLLAAAWVVPGLVGPLATGAVVETVGWRWVFLGVVPFAVVAVGVLWPALQRTRPTAESPYLGVMTLVWAVVAAGCVGVLNLAGNSVSATEVALGVPAAALLGVAAWSLLPRGTLSLGRGLPSVISARGAIGASFLASEAYLPLLLQELYDYSPTQAGGVLAVGSVTWAFGSWLQGRLSESADRFRVLVVGCGGILLGTTTLFLVIALSLPGWLVLLVWGFTLLGVGLAYPTTSLLTMRLSPAEEVGRNSSSLQVAEALATAVSLAAVGAAFSALYTGSLLRAFLAVVAASVVAGAVAVLTGVRARV